MIMAHGLATTAFSEMPAAASSTSAAKPDDPIALDPVIISDTKTRQVASPKFTAPLRDTPQTVAVIPSEVFLQQGATSLSDVLRNTAGITFAAGEGGGAAGTSGDAFYMRGFDTSNSIFMDGVRDVGAYSRDVFNLEQVDVAKGPAGADIGRGGASGYVNLTTKVPRLEEFAAGSTSYGFDEQTSGSRRRATLDVNQSWGNSPVTGTAVRLNAMWQDHDAVGRDFARSTSWAIAPSVALGLDTPSRATLAYHHTEQDNLPDYGLPTALLPGYNSTVPVPSVDRSTFYGFTADRDRVTSDAVTTRLEHDFSDDFKASNQTRYSANRREAVITVPGQNGSAYTPATGLLVRARQANKRDTSIVSNQTNFFVRFTSGAVKHEVSSGLELSRETASSPSFASVALPPILIQASDPNANPATAPFRNGAFTDVVTKTAALYVFDALQFDAHWRANASVRAERYHTHYVSMAANGVPTTIDARHSLLSWKGGLVFKPAPAGSLYAAYAISLTPPGTDFTLSSAAGNQNHPDTEPQRTSNIELGIKWDFNGGRLSTNAAAFRTVNDKSVYTDPVLGPIPAGRQTVQGIELGATRRITDNWIILANAAFLDSEINTGTTAGGNQAGSSLPLIPRWSGNLFTSYRFASGLIVGGGGQYSSAVARRDNNTPAVPRTSPGYWLVNALVSYPVTKRVTVRFNVNNVLDREFVQSANNNGARFNPGAPRAYLLTADFRF
jgi:catecholate siderophore receptor